MQTLRCRSLGTQIGRRMAVGASPGPLLRQFLVEATVLCLFGGLPGIAAVGVSLTVGTSFGFFPAGRASRLDPIETLRYE
ncbi:MAG: hypothetical protein IT428_27325 [Planctomycetaceae bacterium]|nr:hypothetical protein [Planctomycetaceae bacterium]